MSFDSFRMWMLLVGCSKQERMQAPPPPPSRHNSESMTMKFEGESPSRNVSFGVCNGTWWEHITWVFSHDFQSAAILNLPARISRFPQTFRKRPIKIVYTPATERYNYPPSPSFLLTLHQMELIIKSADFNHKSFALLFRKSSNNDNIMQAESYGTEKLR